MTNPLSQLTQVSRVTGKRRTHPLVWVVGGTGLACVAYLAATGIPHSPLVKQFTAAAAKRPNAGPAPGIAMPLTDKSEQTGLKADLAAKRDEELKRAAENKSLLQPEPDRTDDIRNRYAQAQRQDDQRIADVAGNDQIDLLTAPPTPTPPPQAAPTPTPDDGLTATNDDIIRRTKGGQQGNATGPAIVSLTAAAGGAPGASGPAPGASGAGGPALNVRNLSYIDLDPDNPQNLLPLGTFIPVALDQDVVTTDLAQIVWATVEQDVYFRRQLQLPKGIVRLRGHAATRPVQDCVDLYFDVAVFADGAELPIAGQGYSAYDPRWPDRYRVRGVPGILVQTPLWVTLSSIFISGLNGVSAYFADALNPQNNQFTSTGSKIAQAPQAMGASFTTGATNALSQKMLDNLAQYRPYVKLQKGQALFVQLLDTVDISKRRVNGFAAARANDRELQIARARQVYGDNAGSVLDKGTVLGVDPSKYPDYDARHDAVLLADPQAAAAADPNVVPDLSAAGSPAPASPASNPFGIFSAGNLPNLTGGAGLTNVGAGGRGASPTLNLNGNRSISLSPAPTNGGGLTAGP